MHKGKLTPGQNVLWESSRMMLPEHREAFLQRRRDWVVRERPDADEQERARWAEQLAEAMEHRTTMSVTVWERHHERVWHGRIRAVDVAGGRFQLECCVIVSAEEQDRAFDVRTRTTDRNTESTPQRVWIDWAQMIALQTSLCDDDG